MTAKEKQQEALTRAVTNQGTMNLGLIYSGFVAKGIPEHEIKPRENVFTFNAWKALNRRIKAGEHGVKIYVFVPFEETRTDPETGEVKVSRGSSPKTTTVFHISQTIEGGK